MDELRSSCWEWELKSKANKQLKKGKQCQWIVTACRARAQISRNNSWTNKQFLITGCAIRIKYYSLRWAGFDFVGVRARTGKKTVR